MPWTKVIGLPVFLTEHDAVRFAKRHTKYLTEIGERDTRTRVKKVNNGWIVEVFIR